MILLGIDYGRKNIGLAIAHGPLAEPLDTVINSKNITEKIRQICSRLLVDKIIIGDPEGKMGEEVREFANKLKKTTKLQVFFQNETLTSKIVEKKLHEARMKKSKRKSHSHSFAATLILQEYLDFKVSK